MSSTDYTELMHKVAKGDQNAFRLLSQALGQRMFHLAYRLMGYQRASAEDAVQEALLKLWRSAPNWQPTGSVQAYVSRLVYTSCMDIHRRQKPTEELPEELPQADTILDTILDKEQRNMLIGAINQLPVKQKDAVLLHYMGEHSQRNVASMLGTTEKGIERLLARSRKRLRELLPPPVRQGSY
jgi:RNA polymerase sigma-70 factor, ECF subfamily